MKETNCPLCYGILEVRDVAPCDECGASPQELQHFAEGLHTYAEYEVFPGLHLILCNFCHVDFGSINPSFFGLPRKPRITYLHFLKEVRDPALAKDKYCPHCGSRLSFLRFVDEARQRHAR